MDIRVEAEKARRRIALHARTTPVEFSPVLSGEIGARVHLKLENFQRTGSFKFRGAMNKLLALDEGERARGVVAASSGNHGAAVACGASLVGGRAVIFVPEVADPSKVEAIRKQGAEVRTAGEDCVLAEAAAREFAREREMTYISPYNDLLVVAGQGTIGLELVEQLEHIDAVLLALGGGGLASGVGGVLKALDGSVEVVACSPENSCVMHDSLAAGRILEQESLPTLSDGTAGGVEADTITFELCQRWIDRRVLVNEEDIAAAMRTILVHHHVLVEGAAGVAVAGLAKARETLVGKEVAVILCGANVSIEVLKSIL